MAISDSGQVAGARAGQAGEAEDQGLAAAPRDGTQADGHQRLGAVSSPQGGHDRPVRFV